jgi:signal transduction histidine kinase
MITSIFFVLRIGIAWVVTFFIGYGLWTGISGSHGGPPWFLGLGLVIMVFIHVTRAMSHVHRVRLIKGQVDAASLANRQRRQIEVPLEAGAAFDLVDAAVRELPNVETIDSTRDSLQVRATVKRVNPYRSSTATASKWPGAYGRQRNQISVVVVPGDNTASVTLVCEPEGAAWTDWYVVDLGTNLENAEAITRAITRRVAALRRDEKADAKQTATEKELTVARLSLLHAQVEPHFLYNTLASAQYLTRSDPPRADEMLGYLITYLRTSVPRAEDSLATLGEELERAQAYLQILKIRMGDRLSLNIQVPDALKPVPLPPMMLQTLVENAIKHGLEPVPGGGSIWIFARIVGTDVSVTVADDGRGFNTESSGTGIGLKNVRERLRLAYGDAASFAIVANFPKGVAATITVPVAGPREPPHA